MQCDAVLLNGSVIVDESMLTGESVPITKVALVDEDDSERFNLEKHSKHVLFCGTKVLQTRFYGGKDVKARVIRTAFATSKGQLVRSIMYPKPIDASFYRDLFMFILFLSTIAAIGMVYSITLKVMSKAPIRDIIIRTLDIITIVVPPALPAALSVGSINAAMRLQKQKIFCISKNTINTCGAINVVCFDKTGTLTEDGLDFQTIRATVKSKEKNEKTAFTEEFNTMDPNELMSAGSKKDIITAVATCHSLTRIEGVLNGDPLDLILFNQTGWNLKEGEQTETELFDNVQPTIFTPPPEHHSFYGSCVDSALQRMSVIVSNPSDDTAHDMTLYCKGSPEMIRTLCDEETIPDDYMEKVNYYAQHGYRLIAIAQKKLEMNFAKASKVPRAQVECDLELLGMVVMENRLKPVTLNVINQLNAAHIRTVMVTGDNLLTAMSVARECGIIRPNKRAYLVEHLPGQHDERGRTMLVVKQAVSSSQEVVKMNEDEIFPETFEPIGSQKHFVASKYHMAISELLGRLVGVCDVFARMSPDQKQEMINLLQDIDYTVAMCGDGANDCGALKAAHAGISLSDAEASIAAPFTSKVADIRCVPIVIREGRAALVTMFSVFKYMAGYSLAQFSSILLLYWSQTNLTDLQFLYVDLFLITITALFLGSNPAADELHVYPPPNRLMTLSSFFSVVGQLVINLGAQTFIYLNVQTQSWFYPYAIPAKDSDDADLTSFEATAEFSLWPISWLTSLFDNMPIPDFNYRLFIMIVSIMSGVVGYIYENVFVHFIIEHLFYKWRKARQVDNVKVSTEYERIHLSVGSDPRWIDRANRLTAKIDVKQTNEHANHQNPRSQQKSNGAISSDENATSVTKL
ncbi:hypothetical protein WR25_19898 [Diploscapter pachys]|uniref:P-type ATPase A domain-containing protein n=1 Tax=Diploscapter pachys TaxID=2018661 RepID=A0A2A2JWN4_9BILA|nr:hypothetical protein WR25_19898 [Diploscapter pachys]